MINQLESIRRDFFLGGPGQSKKMSWVKWDNVISSYGLGGLNIGSLRAKNWALMGKWWWRFWVEGDALWVKVIRSIHGSDGGLTGGEGLRDRYN